jgi:hypothetical protein
MKKITAFLISTVIPVIIPMCVIVSLPVCVAQKYLPQDLKNNLRYGVQFFSLVLAANGDSLEQQPVTEQELTPYVESTVTSMTLASYEPEQCPFAPTPQIHPAVLEVDSFPTLEDQDELESKIDIIVDKALDDGNVSKAELKKLQDLKFEFQQEALQNAIERAIHRVEVVNQIHAHKKNQKPVRIVVKTKSLSPA